MRNELSRHLGMSHERSNLGFKKATVYPNTERSEQAQADSKDKRMRENILTFITFASAFIGPDGTGIHGANLWPTGGLRPISSCFGVRDWEPHYVMWSPYYHTALFCVFFFNQKAFPPLFSIKTLPSPLRKLCTRTHTTIIFCTSYVHFLPIGLCNSIFLFVSVKSYNISRTVTQCAV